MTDNEGSFVADLCDSLPAASGRPEPQNPTWGRAALARALGCPRRGLTRRRPSTVVEPLCGHLPRRTVDLRASAVECEHFASASTDRRFSSVATGPAELRW